MLATSQQRIVNEETNIARGTCRRSLNDIKLILTRRNGARAQRPS